MPRRVGKVQPVTLWRRASQMAFFIFTGQWLAIGWLRCPFGVPFVSCPSCPSTDCPGKYLFVPFVGLIALSGVLFGRSFCGWACPMGLVEDGLGRLPKPGARFRRALAGADRVLKWLKWGVLALVIWAVFAYNYPPDGRPYEYIVRSPSIFNLESYQLAWALGGGAYKLRFALLAGALVGGLVVSRFWCRYLCPLGALLAVFNKISVFTLRKSPQACAGCGKYPRECIQHTCPGTTDCVMCGDCAQGCPAKAITFGARLPPERETAGAGSQAPNPGAPPG